MGGSYRDPAGFVFRGNGGEILRQINHSYRTVYQQLIDSGLYQKLVDKCLLIPHKLSSHLPLNEKGWLIIEPEEIPFISYPYEWCFSQLKDAALLTLQIQQEALACGMTLKDASAYNVQFLHGKPVFIDTLSFDVYEEGKPWTPYKQFCEHFLAPLALMAHSDVRLNSLLLSNLEGIPLDLGSKLLPWTTYFQFGILLHVHLHAKAQRKYADNTGVAGKTQTRKMPKNALLQLVQSLESAVKSLTWQPHKTLWADYYQHTNYQDEAMRQKEAAVAKLLSLVKPKIVWDVGANTGRFSEIAAEAGAHVIAMDFDIGATEIHYLEIKARKQANILPLVIDVTQPSPAIGWRNQERDGLFHRPKSDTILALALVHHLAIGKNIPFVQISAHMAELSATLIIEFVPKKDSQVQRLLAAREDIFPEYSEEGFEAAFSKHFVIRQKLRLEKTERTLYWMSRHEAN